MPHRRRLFTIDQEIWSVFLDGRHIAPGTTLTAEVCVVGAGPAGLTIARALSARGHAVLLLESGGLTADPDTQALAGGEMTGEWDEPLVETRARQFGGTANMWSVNGRSGEYGFRTGWLADIDFEARPWLAHSVGWPFALDELVPYYDRAHEQVGLSRSDFGGERWLRSGEVCLPVDPATLHTTVWQFAATESFTVTPRDEIAASDRITALLWANVVAMDVDEHGRRITGLQAACLGGARFRVEADTYVLATGGLENARLLLLSRSPAHPDGIGNGHDQVGRYFMEHQYVHAGRFIPRDRSLFRTAGIYDTHGVGGTPVTGKLDVASDVLRRERLLNASAGLVPQHRLARRVDDEAIAATATLARSVARGRLPEAPLRLAWQAIRRLDYVAAAALRKASGARLFPYFIESPDFIIGPSWSELSEPDRRWHHFDVVLHTEQAPDPRNRVTLSEQRDALGTPMAHLDWRLLDVDIDSILRMQQLLATEIQRAGLGRFVPRVAAGRPHVHHNGLHHHMGTTRMHVDPRQGVVDEHSRVHGVDNLFVSGCSVFPSGGYINPTLTIVALALRVADRVAAVHEAAAVNIAGDGSRAW